MGENGENKENMENKDLDPYNRVKCDWENKENKENKDLNPYASLTEYWENKENKDVVLHLCNCSENISYDHKPALQKVKKVEKWTKNWL